MDNKQDIYVLFVIICKLFNSIVILQNKIVKTSLEMNRKITRANVEKCF